jgi:ABC-type nitrate/sulfonate/bicarbonate transport system substrate-binding protein
VSDQVKLEPNQIFSLSIRFLEAIMNQRFLLLAALASTATIGLAQQKNATVSLALDWVPNVNHVGVYVAQAQGWYAQRGINLKILPYGSVSPDVLVATNRADLGISSGEGIATAAVMANRSSVYNTNTSALAVLESSKILRPKDLDGKIYAAFGAPYEKAILERIIKTDGGKGVFKSPTLSVYGLEALLAGKADFMWIFEGVEGVEASRADHKLRTFPLSKFGVPDYYTPVFSANKTRVTTNAANLKAFLEVTARGYDFARKNPKAATALMVKALPKGSVSDPKIIEDGIRWFEGRGAYAKPGKRWGVQSLKLWTDYPKFLLENQVFPQSKMKSLEYGQLFTNALLPAK